MAEDLSRQRNTAQELEHGAANAKKAAKSAATAGKAAAKAAAGDVVGAAKDVAKDEGLRKTLLAFALIGLVLPVMLSIILMAAPLAVFEGLKGYYDTYQASYGEYYYAQNPENAFEALGASITGSVHALEDVWNSIMGKQSHDSASELDSDTLNPDDIMAMSREDSLRKTYKKKIEAAQDKWEARAKQIEREIKNATYDGAIDDYFSGRANELKKELKDTDPQFNKFTYNGVRVEVPDGMTELSTNDAIRLIALYSTLYDCDMSEVEPYKFMKWLGYYSASANKVSIRVGNAVSLKISGWSGEFMPQYLMEEAAQNKSGNYDGNKASVIDLLCYVSTPDFEDIEPDIKVVDVYKTEDKIAVKYDWFREDSEEAELYMEYVEDDRLQAFYDKADRCDYKEPPEPDYDTMPSPVMRDGKEVGYVWVGYYSTYKYGKIVHNYNVKYTYTLVICPRSTNAISDLAGFYEKEADR